MRLGVDIGGVIIQKPSSQTEDEPLGFFSENWLTTPTEPQVIETLHHFTSSGIIPSANIFLVSKCGKQFRAKTLQFLHHVKFFSRTGIPEANVKFCEERGDKAEICQSLGITHFIDDSLSVLRHLLPVPCIVRRFYYSPVGSGQEIEQGAHYMVYSPLVTIVRHWEEVKNILTPKKEN